LHEIWQTYLGVALVAYLLGSIPFGYILVKLFLKQDIRQTGSGNIGATNVARSGKKGLAIATLLLDGAKGAAAVIFATWLLVEVGVSLVSREAAEIRAFAALLAIAGHIFPVWLRFKGGKGVATGVGAFFAFNPFATMVAVAVFVMLFLVTRIVSLSSIIATVVFPVAVLPFAHSRLTVVFAVLSALTIILKHHANIRRLLNGTEPKFTTKKTPPSPLQVEKNA
jgi:glycerol-3-phosphate acyltransferase PlsY